MVDMWAINFFSYFEYFLCSASFFIFFWKTIICIKTNVILLIYGYVMKVSPSMFLPLMDLM